MPIQRRTINIGSVLGMLAPEPSETSNIPLAPGFSEGESVMKKRKKGEEEVEAAKEQKDLIQAEHSATKPCPKKEKAKKAKQPKRPPVTFHTNANIRKSYQHLGNVSFMKTADR